MSVNSAGQVTITTTGSSDKCAIGAVTPPPAGTVALTVTKPTGGTITATGINCGVGGNDCSENVAEGASVTLTAAPSGSGYSHGTWGGDCAAAGATSNACALTNITDGEERLGNIHLHAARAHGLPHGVDCSKTLPWPVNPQQNLTQLGNSTVAYKIELTGQAGLVGKLASALHVGRKREPRDRTVRQPGRLQRADSMPQDRYLVDQHVLVARAQHPDLSLHTPDERNRVCQHPPHDLPVECAMRVLPQELLIRYVA